MTEGADADMQARIEEIGNRESLNEAPKVVGTGVECPFPHCDGEIVRRPITRYYGDPGRRIIGPGGRDQMVTTYVLHCDTCQVLFFDFPKENRSGETVAED